MFFFQINDESKLVLWDHFGNVVNILCILDQSISFDGSAQLFLEDGRTAELSATPPAYYETTFWAQQLGGSNFLRLAESIEGYHTHIETLTTQFSTLGVMDMEGMRLSCASLQHWKSTRSLAPYPFTPWIIDFSDLKKTLHLLISHPELCDSHRPGRKTVIVRWEREDFSEAHWSTIEVLVTDPTQPKLLVMGMDVVDEYALDQPWDDECIQEIGAMHANLSFYVNDFRLQRVKHACAFFALYSAWRLQRIENYLPGQMNLFDYLKGNTLATHGKIHTCRLPLGLILSAQTSELWNTECFKYPGEITLPLNKKTENFAAIIEHHKVSVPTAAGASKEQNHLMEHFRAKTEKRNKAFFSSVGFSNVLAREASFMLPLVAADSFTEPAMTWPPPF